MNWENELNEIDNNIISKIENVVLDFIELISEYMKKNNINQKELAKILKISNPAVSKLLRGNENLSIKRMVEISNKLGFDISIEKNSKTKINISIDKGNAEIMLNGCLNKNEIKNIKEFLSEKTNSIINIHYLNIHNFKIKPKIYQKDLTNNDSFNDSLILAS